MDLFDSCTGKIENEIQQRIHEQKAALFQRVNCRQLGWNEPCKPRIAFPRSVSVVAVVPNKAEYREEMIKALQDAVARNPSPQGQQMVQFFSGTAGILFLTVLALGFILMFFLIIASITGALTANVFTNKKTP